MKQNQFQLYYTTTLIIKNQEMLRNFKNNYSLIITKQIQPKLSPFTKASLIRTASFYATLGLPAPLRPKSKGGKVFYYQVFYCRPKGFLGSHFKR